MGWDVPLTIGCMCVRHFRRKELYSYTVDAFQYLCGLVSLRLFLSVIFLMEYASVASICPCQVSVGLNRMEKLCVTDMFILLVPTYGVVNLLVPH